MTPKQKKNTTENERQGSTAIIRKLVRKLDKEFKSHPPDEKTSKILSVLKDRHKEEIVEAALLKYYNSEELKPYQAELIKMQTHLERTGKKMIILFDGRDASGKGGTIRRVTRYMNEKRYRVEALGKPNEPKRLNCT